MTETTTAILCSNQDHSRPVRAVARVSYPSGRFNPVTGCIGCMTWAVRDALGDGIPILLEPIEDWTIDNPRLVKVPAQLEAVTRAKVADEIEAEYRRRESDGLAIGPLLHAADIARGEA